MGKDGYTVRSLWRVVLFKNDSLGPNWESFCRCYIRHRKGCNLIEDILGWGDPEEFGEIWQNLLVRPLTEKMKRAGIAGLAPRGGVGGPGDSVRVMFAGAPRGWRVNFLVHELMHQREAFLNRIKKAEFGHKHVVQAGNEVAREAGYRSCQYKHYHVNRRNYRTPSGLLEDSDRHCCCNYLRTGKQPSVEDPIWVLLYSLPGL